MGANTRVTLTQARWLTRVTYLRGAGARAQTQAPGSKCSVLLCFLLYASLPHPEPSMASCGPGDKVQTSQVVPLAPKGKAAGARGWPRAVRRGRGWCSRCVGYSWASSRSWDVHPRPSISCESPAQMLCAFSHRSLQQRRLQECSHLGNALLFLLCVPLWHKHYKV